jgi:hypothetical protein
MSVTIIDKTHPPAPFFTYKPRLEIFKTTLEEQRYWAEEKRRWIEGYNEDINGMLYFYATQIKIKDRVRGTIFRPTVRDADVAIFKAIEQAQKEGKALYMLKARGIGFSTVGMTLPFYFFKTQPNSNCVATSKDKKTLATLFTEKTVIALDEFDSPYTKFDLLQKNQTATDSNLKVGMKYINPEGKERYAESRFDCRDTQESDKAATNFSGSGAIYGFADEAPLMPRMELFFNSVIEIFKDHSINKVVGTLILGGTAEATIKPDEIAKLANIWANAEVKNILPLFLPATYGKHMTNGHSDHERARNEILAEREKLNRLDDKSQLQAHIKNNPLSIEEIFQLAGSNSWDDYALENINRRAVEIPKERTSIGRYSTDGVSVKPNDNGKVKILEHPIKGVQYIIGVDGIMTSELSNTNKDASDFASVGMKGVDPQSDLQFAPIFMYKERPKSIEDANLTVLSLLKHYNQYGKCKVFTETNAAGEHLLKMIQNAGLWECVGFRKDLNNKGWVDTKKAGFYRNDPIKDWQYEAANVYFKKYADMVKFQEIITDAQKPYDANKDVLDAFLACLYGWGTGDLLGEKTKTKPPPSKMMVCEWDEANKCYKWVERTYNNQ